MENDTEYGPFSSLYERLSNLAETLHISVCTSGAYSERFGDTGKLRDFCQNMHPFTLQKMTYYIKTEKK